MGQYRAQVKRGFSEELLAGMSRRFAEAGLTGVVSPVLEEFHAMMDYTRIGAMPVLGVGGLILIGHGRSRADAVVGPIQTAMRAVQVQLLEALREGLEADP